MMRSVETVYPVAKKYIGAIATSLLGTARLRFGDIEPCSGKSWDECITTLPYGRMALWFNDREHSTHIVTEAKV